MRIDAAPGHRTDERPDGTPVSGGDGSDRPAEQAAESHPRGHDARGQPNAETRTRGEYADARRAGTPLRAGSPGNPEPADGSRGDGRAGTGTGWGTRCERAGPDRGVDATHAVTVPGESGRADLTVAEPRTREHYAEAMRRDGAVTHFHGEFKGRPLDLYTDGTRWAAADTPDREETITGTGDLPDLLPTGEELIAGAGEGSSRLERLRRDVYEESDDETDVIEKDANVIHDVFARPPTSSYEATPAPEPHIFATQHPGIDAGTAATALFTFGLVIDRAVQWAVGYYDKHAKGR
jgi:hypothetical protein